jgi:hypothetical protein
LNGPVPRVLHILSLAFLSFSFLCAAILIIDELRRPQKMMIMNFVWPITLIYFGPGALWGYFRSGPKMTKEHHQQMQQELQAERWRESESARWDRANRARVRRLSGTRHSRTLIMALAVHWVTSARSGGSSQWD